MSLFAISTFLFQSEQRSLDLRRGGFFVHQTSDTQQQQSEILQEIQAEQKRIEQKLDRIEIQLANAAPKTTTLQKAVPAEQRIAEGVPCQFVFFLGGGKSGSTTLASWLKHSAGTLYAEYTPDSRFLDGGKEICVGKKKSVDFLLANMVPSPANMDACPEDRSYILDGCPSLFQKNQFVNLHNMFQDRGKFIVLVRDPVDRLVSHYNDNRPPRKIPDIDTKIQRIKPGAYEGLSRVGDLLENALSTFGNERIIVVINEMMKTHPQAVMDDVLTFLGLPNRTIVDAPPKNALNHRDVYSWPSDIAIHKTRQRFLADTQKFIKLLGITNLPWNTAHALQSVRRNTNNASLYEDTVGVAVTKPKVAIAGYAKYLESVTDQGSR